MKMRSAQDLTRNNQLSDIEAIRTPDFDDFRGLTTKNFRRVGRNGIGSPMNSYAHAMAWFNDHLYVGTTRGILFAPKPFERESRLVVWPIKVPENIWDADYHAEIWSYNPATDHWLRVYSAPFIDGKDGFRAPRVIGFRTMAVFQGSTDPAPALYTAGWSTHQGPGAAILRTINGTDFDEVFDPVHCESDVQTFRTLYPFKGRLFAATTGRAGQGDTKHGDLHIYVNEDPANAKWELACEPYFGDPKNVSVWTLCSFAGHLYAGVMNPIDGFQIWRTSASGTPPFKWSKVLTHGAYRGRLNEIAMTMCEFNGSLYVGSAIQFGGNDRIYGIGPARPEILRLNRDDSWDLIMGNPRMTPDGLKVPLSGLDPGFTSPFAAYIWYMCAHDGYLYAATSDISVFLRFANRNQWPTTFRKIWENIDIEEFINNKGGLDLWRTYDGVRWAPVTRNGFGNPYNLGGRTMASSPYGLFVGTANPFGPEVATKRTVGWVYSPNPDGGTEIWLGSNSSSIIPAAATDTLQMSVPRVDAATAADNRNQPSDIIDEFYDFSGFRHVGFWNRWIKSPKMACENLMEELIGFIRGPVGYHYPKPSSGEEAKKWVEKRLARLAEGREQETDYQIDGRILDVGCGMGASTRYLLRYFAADSITGVTDSPENLECCRRLASEILFKRIKVPKLNCSNEDFDYVLCVESLGRHRRAALFKEIYRVLRPEGRVVCSDLLLQPGTKRTKRISFFRKNSSALGNLEEYKILLERTGFIDIEIADVSKETLSGFIAHRDRYFQRKVFARQISEDMATDALKMLPVRDEPVLHYLIVSARKPLTANR
jgi:SAM-dependent methyltransferase